MTISLDKLRYFVAAAELEHVGLAAKAMAISPSVISSSINIIEEEYEVQLFDRRGNRIYLNENGKLLLAESRKILAQVKDIPTNIFKSQELSGSFRMAGSHYLTTNYLGKSFFELQEQYPSITGEIISVDTGVAVANLLAGSIDLALVFNPIKHELLEETILYTGDFVIAVSKTHPVLKSKKSKAKQILELNEHPSISFRASIGSNYCESHPVFANYGLKTNHSMFYDNDYLAIEHIKRFDSWAFLPDFLVEKFSKDIVMIKPNGWNAPMSVSAVMRSGKDNRIGRELISTLSREGIS